MSRRSYAVWWEEGAGPRHAGKLELGALHLLLWGNGSGRLAVPLDEITSVDCVRGELALVRPAAPALRIGSLDAPGTLLEVSDLVRRRA